MLAELNISNFAIIDNLYLRLGPGFNALTGETGAGKSIIIDALGALLGSKIGPEFVRHGAQSARVEGQFDLTTMQAAPRALLMALLAEYGLADTEDGSDETVIISREINSSGRTVARVNCAYAQPAHSAADRRATGGYARAERTRVALAPGNAYRPAGPIRGSIRSAAE